MSNQWLTSDEKRDRKAARSAAALREAQVRTFGDPRRADDIRSRLDRRAQPLFDRMTFAGINPESAPLDRLAAAAPAIAAAVDLLRARPRVTMSDLVAAIASRRSVSAGTAQRDAYVAVSILTSCDRAQRDGPFLELR